MCIWKGINKILQNNCIIFLVDKNFNIVPFIHQSIIKKKSQKNPMNSINSISKERNYKIYFQKS